MWRGRGGNYLSLSVVIAAVNESKTIARVITGIKILNIVDKIILVDDGSTDDTPNIAKGMGCEIIKNNKRIGQTRSLRRGIIATNTDLIITMDADMDHLPSDIPKLLASMEEHHADVVISRRSELPRISEIIMSKIICNTTGVIDTISGFRLICRHALNQVEFDNDDTWGSLFLIRCAKKGLKIIETPVEAPAKRLVTRTGGNFRSNMKILKALGMDLLCIVGLI
jgi:polyprenyl-phospho-N-acetylgalactosaminyl synthase